MSSPSETHADLGLSGTTPDKEATRSLREAIAAHVAYVVTERSGGTGTVAAEDGRMLIDAHVVDDTGPILVVTPTGDEYRATIETIDRKNDLAVLAPEPGVSLRSPLTIIDTRSLSPGQMLAAAGYPQDSMLWQFFREPLLYRLIHGLKPDLAIGVYQGIGIPAGEHPEVLQELKQRFDAKQASRFATVFSQEKLKAAVPVTEGFSGGPLLDLQSRGVGFNDIMAKDDYYFTPADRAQALLASDSHLQFENVYQSSTFTLSNALRTALGASLLAFQGPRAFMLLAGAIGAAKLVGDGAEKPHTPAADRGYFWTKATMDFGTTVVPAYSALMYEPLGRIGRPLVGGAAAVYGSYYLATDADRFVHSRSLSDKWKFGLATACDTATTAGAVLSFIPAVRRAALVMQAVGFLGRFATDLIPNELVSRPKHAG